MEEELLAGRSLEAFTGAVGAAFLKGRSLVAHHLDSFNDFCDRLPGLYREMEELRVDRPEHQKFATVRFSNIRLFKPEVGEGDQARPLLPQEARLRNLTYACCMRGDVSLKIFSTGKKSDNEELQTQNFRDVVLGEIPCMINSKFCHTYDETRIKEDPVLSDPGGYFIIQGAEKAVVAQEERFLQRCSVSWKKGWKAFTGWPPRPLATSKNIVTVKLHESEGEQLLYLLLPGVEEIPLFIALRALGAITDREAFAALHCSDDGELTDLLIPSFREAESEMVNLLAQEGEEDFRDRTWNLRYVASKIRNPGDLTPVQAANNMLDRKLFPGSPGKPFLLGYLAYYLCSAFLQRRSPATHALKSKRVLCAGELFTSQITHSTSRFLNELGKKLKKSLSWDKSISPKVLFDNTIGRDFQSAFRNGKWAGFPESTVVMALQRTNHTQTISNLRHVRTPAAYAGVADSETRYPNMSHVGRLCFVETPEGEDSGLVKTMALFVKISSDHPESEVLEFLHGLGVSPVESFSEEHHKVFLNGRWIGMIEDGQAVVDRVRENRLLGILHHEVEVAMNNLGEVNIHNGPGRCLRPVFVLKNSLLHVSRRQAAQLNSKSDPEKINFLVKEGIVQYLGDEEEEGCIVATTLKQLNEAEAGSIHYTHLELHPASVLSVGASLIPFANHNQSIRVTHQSQKHGKQAIGFYSFDPSARFHKTSRELFYPQKILVSTRISQWLDNCKLMNGQSCVVAVASYTGYNQEDSIILNQASLDRGLFRSRHLTTRTYTIEPSKSSEEFRKPAQSDISGHRRRAGVLEKLDGDGFPPLDASLEAGNLIIGKLSPNPKPAPGEGLFRDHSVMLTTFEGGCVDKVVLASGSNGSSRIARVQLARARAPQVGDKFSSMHGQKGVVGLCMDQEDLFFTRQGIVPDIIINPHAFPTRMTLGQLLEGVAGKAAACGVRPSSTPFAETTPEKVAEALLRAGFQPWGNERVCNGMYGGMMKTKIFMGINFYQQLIHMADDRIKWRRIGRTHPLTRQPIGDRQRYGGIKFSEMERDCLLAHGAAGTVQERMFRLSDLHQVFVCKVCNRMASIKKGKLPECRFCDKHKAPPEFALLEIPYSCKLLVQELNSMCVDIRLIPGSL